MINKTFLAAFAICLFCSGTHGQSTTVTGGAFYKDPAGDVKTVEAADHAFDITGLSVEARGADTLRFTITTKEPIPEKPKTGRTWIGLYVDLDQNTGNGLGGDDLLITLTSESDGNGFLWKAKSWTPGKSAQQFEFTTSLISLNGKRLTMEVSSPKAFRAYPRFFVNARSQKEGIWIDQVEAAPLRPITFFPFTEESLSAKEGMTITKFWDPSAGKFMKKFIPIDDATQEVWAKLNIRRANIHEKWVSMFRITLYDENDETALEYWLALSTSRKGQGVMRVYLYEESEGPHFLEDIPVPVTTFRGKHEMILRFVGDSMEFEIDGQIIERQRKDFKIEKARMQTVGADIDIELNIR